MAGGGGDAAGLIGRHLPGLHGLHGRPDPGQPVPQIQPIPDQPARGPIRHAQYTAQLSRCEVPDRWGAVPAQLDWVFGAGQPSLHHRGAGMQIGPMRSDLKSPGFGGDQGVFVGLRCGQRLRGVQPHQIIFEHAFNIW